MIPAICFFIVAGEYLKYKKIFVFYVIFLWTGLAVAGFSAVRIISFVLVLVLFLCYNI